VAYSRIAFAQISANPAYVDESGVSHLHEPAFPTEEKVGLHTLAGIEEVNRFRTVVADAYLTHVSAKVEIVCGFAANKGCELVVFPEYSISSAILPACKELSDGLGLVIVAGSHVTTRHSMQDYRTVGLPVKDEMINRAICPVFRPGLPPSFCEKLTRSKWESSLVAGQSCEPIEVSLGDRRIELRVLICLDAISESLPTKGRSKRQLPLLHVIPSLTPKVGEFYDKARLLLASDSAVLFVNIAEFGESRAFARTENATGWRIVEDGTEPLPKFSEALVTLELDLASQFQIRKSTQEHFAAGKIEVFPLLYPDSSPEAMQYAELVEELKITKASSIPGLEEQVRRYAILDERLFPSLLQQKISHFLQHIVAPGLENDATWLRWLEPIVVKATDPTDSLRWEFCGNAAQLLNDLMLSEKYPDKTEQLTAVHKHLVNRRKELGKRVNVSGISRRAPVASEDVPPVAGITASFQSPFYDREAVMDDVRRFVESSEKTCLILAGMRGIGKTSAAKEVFKKVLPPTWKNVWVSLTEGASHERLLSEIAYRCRIRPPAELQSEAAQVEIVQNLLLYLSQTPRVALVLDDLQYLADPSGDFSDGRVGSFLSELIKRIGASRNKLLLITTNPPRFDGSLASHIEVSYLKGLEKKYAENLLSFWFHFEREDLQGQPVEFPENLFRVLNGHPLGLRIAAKMWAENPLDQGDLSMFKRLRETVVNYVLDRVTFSPREQDFLRFASVFRLPIGRELFLRWRKDEAAFLIDSLVGKSFLETDNEKYQLHPMIREHFYNSTQASALQPFHRLAGSYFLENYSRSKSAGTDPDPEMLGEAVHHYLAAGDREKVRSFSLYRSELKPIALNHYRKSEYDRAFKDYSLLVQLDDTDIEAHFHLALIYGRRKEWDHAEHHFGRAITINPKAYWVYQGYAHLKLQAGHIDEAEHLLRKSQQIKEYHSPTLVDLGRIKERQAEFEEAEDYYRKAITADGDNAFAYAAYAKFLLGQGRYEEGLEMALAAAEINPRDSRNRELVKDLRLRVESAKRWLESQTARSKSAKQWDVFISHASEDKAEFVGPLAEGLRSRGVKVWYDEFSLTLGDSLRQMIDHGLANSRYGVVILSKNFFAKRWPTAELNGLATKEVDGTKVILPVWHRVTFEEVRSFSPILADKLAVRSDQGLETVVARILEILGPRRKD
jgi:tetratricopeptide (TPR) repeat protein/Cdc6-like AAA superfamily ATPase